MATFGWRGRLLVESIQDWCSLYGKVTEIWISKIWNLQLCSRQLISRWRITTGAEVTNVKRTAAVEVWKYHLMDGREFHLHLNGEKDSIWCCSSRDQQKHGEEDGIFICNLVNLMVSEAWRRGLPIYCKM